jgi:hypothetical protein
MKKILYYVDFVLGPLSSIALLLAAGISLPNAIRFICGWIVWTLLEFVIHHAAHHLKGIREEHAHHHAHPKDISGPTSFTTILIYLALWFLVGSSILSGILAGYSYFIWLHYAIHRDWVSGEVKIRHDHHHEGKHGSFGVTTCFWDWVLSKMIYQK